MNPGQGRRSADPGKYPTVAAEQFLGSGLPYTRIFHTPHFGAATVGYFSLPPIFHRVSLHRHAPSTYICRGDRVELLQMSVGVCGGISGVGAAWAG